MAALSSLVQSIYKHAFLLDKSSPDCAFFSGSIPKSIPAVAATSLNLLFQTYNHFFTRGYKYLVNQILIAALKRMAMLFAVKSFTIIPAETQYEYTLH